MSLAGLGGTPPIATTQAVGSGLAALAAPMAFAAPTLAALAAIANQFGSGTAQVEGSAPETGPGRSMPAAHWGGIGGAGYDDSRTRQTRQADALGQLDQDLRGILAPAADATNWNHARIEMVIADVNSALTALGSVADTPAGWALILAALTLALQRAGLILAQGEADAAATRARLEALAEHYAHDSAPSGGGPPGTRPAGAVGQWIDEALAVLAASGHDTRNINPAEVAAIIQHESGGNPNAINLWDSNAAKGIPSKGLMQTIDPTFNAYALPGHHDIWNPVDNIVAGIRYAEHRYGSVSDVPGIQGLHNGSGYVGY